MFPIVQTHLELKGQGQPPGTEGRVGNDENQSTEGNGIYPEPHIRTR